MHTKAFILYTIFVCLSCNDNNNYAANIKTRKPAISGGDTNPYKAINEIPVPVGGFVRIKKEEGSFANWLSGVKLKKDKTVYQYDGIPKRNQTAQFAVLDVSVGNKDLQQCADAVMRLRAEYLFAEKNYQAIHFTDNAGTVYQFNEPYTRQNLQSYLQRVFSRCGTASLSNQLSSVAFSDIEPGDVIIRGGFPGHAVIVMDVATNKEGLKVYLLAQSYMPAQDIHVLVNPGNEYLSPWYLVSNAGSVETPEYLFTRKELKRW